MTDQFQSVWIVQLALAGVYLHRAQQGVFPPPKNVTEFNSVAQKTFQAHNKC